MRNLKGSSRPYGRDLSWWADAGDTIRAQVAEETVACARVTPATLMKKIKQLEQTTYHRARDLEFEESAKLRDGIQRIRQSSLELPEVKVGL